MSNMGVYVHLAVVKDRVSAAAWRRIYEKARHVAKHWTPRPLSLGWRRVGAVRVPQYTRDIENREGLHLVGDADTLITGESFIFPKKLPRSTSWRKRAGSPATPDGDVLVAVAYRSEPEPIPLAHGCELFGNKTLGLSYHVLLVALGMLVENALPGTAVVYGDVSLPDGLLAYRGVASLLGEKLELPVVLDAERLRRRLAAFMTADMLDRTIRDLTPPSPFFGAISDDLFSRLRRTPDDRLCHDLENVVLSCPDPAQLSAPTRRLLRKLVESIRSHVVRGELRQQVEQWGAARTRTAIARGALQREIHLTSMTWDAIEVADLDELAFVYGAISMKTREWRGRRALRAVLDNRALRRA